MQKLGEPHMAVNHHEFKCLYSMWNTWDDIQVSVPPEQIIGWVAVVAKGAPGGKLKNLVLNSHGAPGQLILGQGFSGTNVQLFSAWSGLINMIWLNACEIAKVDESGNGLAFVSALSNATGAVVMCSQHVQWTGAPYAYGMIDMFEGSSLRFEPGRGNVWGQCFDTSEHQEGSLMVPDKWE